MNIQGIQKILKGYAEKSEFIWQKESLPGVSFAETVQRDVFGGSSVCFMELSVREDYTGFAGVISSVTVAGQKSPSCRMQVQFQEGEKGLVCEMQAQFAPSWIPFAQSRTGICVTRMEYNWQAGEQSVCTICRGEAELTWQNICLSGNYEINGNRASVLFCCGPQSGNYSLEDVIFGEEGRQYLSIFPEELTKMLEALTVEGVMLQWNTKSDSLELFSQEIGVCGGKKWQVTEGLLLGDFRLGIEVQRWEQEQKNIVCGIHGKMDIGKGELPVSVYFQSENEGFYVQTGDADTKVTGLDFLTPFCGQLPLEKLPMKAALDDLFFQSLSLEGNLGGNALPSFEVQVGIDMPLDISGVFSVQEIEFTYSSYEGEHSLTLEGKLQIAGILFALAAEHSQDNWIFSGYTLGPDEISLSGMMESLLKDCGVTDVPLPSIGLNTISCSYDMAKEIFAFSAFAHVGEETANGISFQSICASVDLQMEKKQEKWQYKVAIKGEAELLDSLFDIAYQLDAETHTNKFHLTWKKQPDFSMEKLITDLGFSAPGIPEGLLPTPDQMQMDYDFAKGSLQIEAKSGDNKLLLGSEKGQGESRGFYLAMQLAVSVSLHEIPLAGAQVPELKEQKFSDIVCLLHTRDMENFSAGDIVSGITAKAGLYFLLYFNGERFLYCLKEFSQKSQQVEEYLQGQFQAEEYSQARLQTTNAKEGGSGWEINKKIGPFLLQRILLSCKEGRILVGLSASLETGVLRMELDGATLGIPFAKADPTFALHGFGLSITSPAIRFGGAFCRKDEDTYQGTIMVGISDIMVELAGEYCREPYPSAFVLGELSGREVGPPCFAVNQLQAAFGYNRKLTVPAIDKLDDFVLMQMARGILGQDELLQKADTYFPIQKDTRFVAAGIRARSFEMFEIYAVLAMMFGAEMEFDLLGRAALTLPKNDKNPIISAALLVKLTIRPGSGVIPVDGRISEDSYIIDKNCRLHGGFAFYLWYDGVHKGDFVISVGGYADRFQRPEHYPALDRLGFEWKLTDHLSASGSMYFALTPSAIMAGGRFAMTFHQGCIEAWVRAAIEILIGWKPYCYDFLVDVSVGVKADLGLFRLKVELGCMLHIWGPEFSGVAEIKLWIISFSIPFGSGQKEQKKTISAKEFRESFLPEPERQNSAKLKSGREQKNDAEGDFGGCSYNVQVSGTMFEALVRAPLPFTTVFWQGKPLEGTGQEEVTLRPCDITVEPSLYVEFARVDKNPIEAEFQTTVIRENLPAALWGRADAKTLTEENIALKISVCETEGYVISGEVGKQEKICFSESCLPVLQSGSYQLTAWLDGKELGKSQICSQTIEMKGPRFTLSPEDILGVCPAPGVKGNYETVLPQVMLRRRSLPWERSIHPCGLTAVRKDGKAKKENPWLYVFLLAGDEIVPVQSMAAKDAILPPEGVFFPHLMLEEDEGKEMVSYIDVDAGLFESIFPAEEELCYLAHARKKGEGNANRAVKNEMQEEWYSVAIGNRLPQSSSQGMINCAYLVSVEGYESWWKGGGKSCKKVRLIVLHHWQFESVPQQYHWEELFGHLNRGFLKAEEQEGMSQEMKQKLREGYVPLSHLSQDGSRNVSYYRGPLTPVQVKEPRDMEPDISLNSAWQQGRLLALTNPSIVKLLQKNSIQRRKNAWRRAERQRIYEHMVQTGIEDSVDGLSVSEMDREEPLEVHMLNCLNKLWEGK